MTVKVNRLGEREEEDTFDDKFLKDIYFHLSGYVDINSRIWFAHNLHNLQISPVYYEKVVVRVEKSSRLIKEPFYYEIVNSQRHGTDTVHSVPVRCAIDRRRDCQAYFQQDYASAHTAHVYGTLE